MGLGHRCDAGLVLRCRDAQPYQDSFPVSLNQIKSFTYGSVLCQYPNRPSRLGEDRFKAPATQIVLLCLG